VSTHTVTLSDAQFKTEVLDSQQPVLVDFWATWCAPCVAMKPALDELAVEYAGRAKVATMNIEDHQQTPQAYGIRSIPNLVLFKGGRVVGQVASALPKAKLEELLRKAL
jgi:thioredoxin 1